MFGDPNAEATAELQLDALHMRENELISSYSTKFRTLRAQLNWDDASLSVKDWRKESSINSVLWKILHLPFLRLSQPSA